jgi:hypothetical protein
VKQQHFPVVWIEQVYLPPNHLVHLTPLWVAPDDRLIRSTLFRKIPVSVGLANDVSARISGYRSQPWPEPFPVSERIEGCEGLQKGPLHGVLDIFRIAKTASDQRIDHGEIAVYQYAKIVAMT